jgi:hypothetical protein
MHTVKLEMSDSIYSHIMFLLKNLNSKELKITEETDSFEYKQDEQDTKNFSNHSANCIQEWKGSSEDEVWK